MATGVEARERDVLELLRERYEGNGYTFVPYPPEQLVPSFLEGYRPDAIALRGDERIVVEVKQRSRSTDRQLSKIADRFVSNPGWKLLVVYPDEVGSESQRFSLPSSEDIERQLNEAEQLLTAKHNRAAFILGWAAIEAISRALGHDGEGISARSPREIVEALERNGFVGFEEGKRLRDLLRLRNAAVHGDFGIDVSQSAVERLLEVARHLDRELRAAA